MTTDKPKGLQHPAAGAPLDKIEMLSQPLLNDLGTINPAFLQELEASIRRMPKLHHRLADDQEWSMAAWTTEADILRGFCGHAVASWGGPSTPPGFDSVVGLLRAGLRMAMQDMAGTRMAQLSLCDVHRLLCDILDGLTSFEAWGEAIDLSALLRCTCLYVRDIRRHALAFDVAFYKQYGCSPTHGGMGEY